MSNSKSLREKSEKRREKLQERMKEKGLTIEDLEH